jgi:hypothetical protein
VSHPALADIVTGEASTCEHCGERIYAVVDPYSGTVDWGTSFGHSRTPEDFGCADGTVGEWEGEDGEDAARRYVDCHRDEEVVASRPARSERSGVFVLGDPTRIIG